MKYQKNLMKGRIPLDKCLTEEPRVHRGDLIFLQESEVSRNTAFFKALGDPIRLQMVNLLDQREDLCTCEFEELLGLSQSKVSYHLNILLEAGIISREQHGTWSHYSIQVPGILNLVKSFQDTRS